MNYLYFNDEGLLRCSRRTVKTQNFDSFDNSVIKLTKGKYVIHIGINATVDDNFYKAIDESTGVFTDSPFYISVELPNNTQTFTLCQYAPIHIHLMKIIECTEDTDIVIQSNYNSFTSVNIDSIIEPV